MMSGLPVQNIKVYRLSACGLNLEEKKIIVCVCSLFLSFSFILVIYLIVVFYLFFFFNV